MRRALTAAATTLKLAGQGRLLSPTENWVDEVWTYYDTLGEFRYGIDWRANTISRVRLRAARAVPGQDEPEIVDAGPAADFVDEFMGSVGGRSQLLATLTTLFDVPGESFIIGEGAGNDVTWRVCSSSEVRRVIDKVEIMDVEQSSATGGPVWRILKDPYYITRIWRPHRRIAWRADSPAKAARATMRELDLVNRRIVAQYLSRLASAGIIVFPEEIMFPVRPELEDEPDPFVAEWIQAAREAIQNPGTASSVIPIPMRVPAEYVERIKHIDFTTANDDQLVAKRESAIRRLATQLDMPAEILSGMGDVNHWGAWQIEESAVKVHILPTMEIICHGLTLACMQPILQAQGIDNVEEWLFWYDTSEIVQRPDKSTAARDAYDRLELTGEALRRELGFDESDAPDTEELGDLILKVMARNPQLAVTALEELTGRTVATTSAPQPVTGAVEEPPAGEGPPTGPPNTQDEPPPPPGPDVPQQRTTSKMLELLNRANLRSVPQHVLTAHEIHLRVWPERVDVLHPPDCRQVTCPITWAAFLGDEVGPQTPGWYDVQMSPAGRLMLGPHRAQPRLVDTRAGQVR
jgi:hypothetical protein